MGVEHLPALWYCGDHEGAFSTSAMTSMISFGVASMTTSRNRWLPWGNGSDAASLRKCFPVAASTGSNSSGVAPCRITASRAVAELLADPCHALVGRPGGSRFQPLIGDERRDMFDLIGRSPCGRCRPLMELTTGSARKRWHSGIPIVGADHQVAVALQVGGQPGRKSSSGAALGKMIADGGESWDPPARRPDRGRPPRRPCLTVRTRVSVRR